MRLLEKGSHMPAQTLPQGPCIRTPQAGPRSWWPEGNSHLEHQMEMQTTAHVRVQVNNTLLFGTSRSHVALGASSSQVHVYLNPVSLDILCFYLNWIWLPWQGWEGHGLRFC